MAKSGVRIRIARQNDTLSLFVRAPFLERFFKQRSAAQFGGTPQQQIGTAYTYWSVRRLPQVSQSLAAGYGTESMGFLRAVGLSKGIWLPLNDPMDTDARTSMADSVANCIREIYQGYCVEHEIDYSFELNDVAPDEPTTELF